MSEAWQIVIASAAFLYTTGGYLFTWAILSKLQKHIEWDLEQHRGIAELRSRVEALEALRK